MDRIFGIIPASSASSLVIGGISLVLLCLIGLFAFIAYSSQNVSFEAGRDGLRVSKSLYGRFIPGEKIITEGVKVIDLSLEQEYQPQRRTNGVGLPGYLEGWFRLKNKEKALLFVTDRSSVVYVPTSDNYSVLLSVRESKDLVELLRQY